MTHDRIQSLLSRFRDRHVLVVGDCMLDEYLWGRVTRISPEAPVMVVEQVETTYAAGGASNVAANVVAMDGRASIVAVVGDDAMAARLRQELERQGVGHAGLVTDAGRPTTVKTRILAHNQQVVRVDREERSPVSSEAADALIAGAAAALPGVDAVLFSDYSKGVLTGPVVAEIRALARDAGKPVFANPKPAGIANYRDFSLISVNQSEAEAITGIGLSDNSRVGEAGEELLRICAAEAAIVTLGGRGLALFEVGRDWKHLPVVPLEVYDPCGCGDSAIAAAALARTAGADWIEAASVANFAGNAKVRKRGVVPVTRKEIESIWAVSHALSNGALTPNP